MIPFALLRAELPKDESNLGKLCSAELGNADDDEAADPGADL